MQTVYFSLPSTVRFHLHSRDSLDFYAPFSPLSVYPKLSMIVEKPG